MTAKLPIEPDRGQLDRYLAGDAPPDEHAFVDAWLAGHPDERVFATRLVAVAAAPVGLITEADVDATMSGVYARIATDRSGSSKTVPASLDIRRRTPSYGSRQAGLPRRLFFRVATATLGVGVAVVAVLLSNATTDSKVVTVREYTAPQGEQANVTLPDGSRMTLAPRTRVRYAVTRDGARSAELVGQARFDVEHASARPFTVRTGVVTTTVLGTTFDVRHYAGDPDVRVAVFTGKVRSETRGERFVLLTAGVEGRLTDSTATFDRINDLDAQRAWTSGRLVFKNATVSEMLDALARWYGCEFRIADSSVVAQRVSATIVVQRAEETFHVIREMLDVTLTVDGNVVTLRRAGTANKSNTPARHRRVVPTYPMEVGK